MALRFGEEKKILPKILINIGAGFDIPTGQFITGKNGESIINGGLGGITAIVGAGNNFKSSILHFHQLSAANRIFATAETAMTTYDTEVNIDINKLENWSNEFEYIPKNAITSEMIWEITDKSQQYADEWFDKISKYCEQKEKDKSINVKFTAFVNPYTKEVLEMPLPTFVEIDSLSEFEPKSTIDMVAKDIEDSNTVYMKQGLFKTKVFSQLPVLSNSSNVYFLITAQIGEKINIATGPAMYNQPSRKLQHLKSGESIKGVSNKFYFLSNNSWYAHTASVLKNQNTKLAEYPTGNESQETDLNVVRLTMMRSKSGPSGYTLEVVVSQTEGVLPTLTEFHTIKQNGKFGIGGNDRSYFIELHPEVSLQRTNIRSKIDSDKLLSRAINITSELLQMHIFHSNLHAKGLLCTPAELYNDIKDLGYDWHTLLDTRGWWTVDNYDTRIKPFLSTMDLLKMRKGLYFPYFLNDDKTLKKEYIHE